MGSAQSDAIVNVLKKFAEGQYAARVPEAELLEEWAQITAAVNELGKRLEYAQSNGNGAIRSSDSFGSSLPKQADLRSTRVEPSLASKVKLDAALASMTDAVLISDIDGRFVDFNDAFATFHRFRNKSECATVLAEYPDLLDVCFADGSPAPLERWAVPRALRGETVTCAEYRLRRKDTGESWVGSYSFGPIRDDTGTIVGSVVVGRDITKEKKVEKALSVSAALYRLISENVSDVIWLYELSTSRFVYMSPSVERLRGFTVSEALEQSLSDVLTPESLKALQGRLPARLAAFTAGDDSVRTQTHEVDHTTKSGGKVHTEVVTTLIAGADRRVTHIQGVARDISARRRAEAALCESEQRFARVFEASPVAIGISRICDGKFREVNDAFARLYGYSREEVVGHSSEELGLWEGQSRQKVMQQVERERHIQNVEVTGKTKGGELRELLASIEVFEFAGEPCVVGILTDITERNRAESALRESEERFRAVVENSPDGIFIQTRGCFAYVNKATIALFGAEDASSLLGTQVIERFAPEYREQVKARMWHLNVKRQAVAATDEICLTLQNESKWVSVCAVPFRYGADDGALVFVHDLTQRKQAERERAEAQAQLLQAQKLDSVGRLAGGIAHDFNNRLGVILSYVTFVIDATPPHSRYYADLLEIKNSTERAAALTKQLLAYSRKSVLMPEVLSVNDATSALMSMMKRIIGEDIRLSLVLCPSILPIKIDRGQFEQVLVNLATNARDAMKQGGALVIETRNMELPIALRKEVDSFRPAKYVMLAVTDTGCGMSEETRRLVFEPFFTTKPVGEGTGLGLSVVYGIIRQSGGAVEIVSRLGQGTSVRIYLPSSEVDSIAPNGPTATARTAWGSESILVVEDEEDVSKMVGRVLRASGYRVIEANSGAEALKLAEAYGSEVRVLFTDVVMPNMNGKQLELEWRARWPHVRVIYMSGYDADSELLRGVLAPGDIFVQKPFEAAELALKVREVLDAAPRTPAET